MFGKNIKNYEIFQTKEMSLKTTVLYRRAVMCMIDVDQIKISSSLI